MVNKAIASRNSQGGEALTEQRILTETPSMVTQAMIRRILEAAPRVIAIYAYGSQVRGGVHADSDLDLALLMPRREVIQPDVMIQLAGDLEAMAGLPVEVSVLDPELQLVHCKEVVAHGVPMYVADADSLMVFEMQTLSSYARFCEDRRPVAEAYCEEHAHGRRASE